jgi:hypothetical protein
MKIKGTLEIVELQKAKSHMHQMIATNSLDAGVGYTALRKRIFRLEGLNIRRWRNYIPAYSHAPSGKLLALWLLPKREINKRLNFKK